MASRAGSELQMDDCERTEAWLRGFAATSRSKKLKDETDNFEITDLFLSKGRRRCNSKKFNNGISVGT
jgi:hypothetical protein